MKQTKTDSLHACDPAQLKQLAMQRLRQRLEEDQMTTAELLKVAALPEPERADQPPAAEWTITLGD